MTPEGYYVAVRSMGLRPSNVKDVYIDREGMTQNIPSPYEMTPDQREETIALIRRLRGESTNA
jgi:hypothetical protein